MEEKGKYINTNNQTYFESKAYTKVMDFVIVFSYQNILRFKKMYNPSA